MPFPSQMDKKRGKGRKGIYGEGGGNEQWTPPLPPLPSLPIPLSFLSFLALALPCPLWEGLRPTKVKGRGKKRKWKGRDGWCAQFSGLFLSPSLFCPVWRLLDPPSFLSIRRFLFLWFLVSFRSSKTLLKCKIVYNL